MAHQSDKVYDGSTISLTNPLFSNVVAFSSESKSENDYSFREPKGPFGFGFTFERHGFLVFRGSDSLADWWTDTKIRQRGDPPRHKGFEDYVSSLEDQVKQWVNEVADGLEGFILGGHSLGGAMAVLMAKRLHGWNKSVRAVMTYGAPRVGGRSFSDSYCLHPATWQAQKSSDPVIRLPPDNWDYVHVGNLYQIDFAPWSPTSVSTPKLVDSIWMSATAGLQGMKWFLFRQSVRLGAKVVATAIAGRNHKFDQGYGSFCNEMIEQRLKQLNVKPAWADLAERAKDVPLWQQSQIQPRDLRSLHREYLFGPRPPRPFGCTY